jgi:hypothetical protein
MWLYNGFAMVMGFIVLLKLVATINYSSISNSHTLQVPAVCTKPVFLNRRAAAR